MPEAPKLPRTPLEAIRPFIGTEIRDYEIPPPHERREVPADFEGTPQVKLGLKMIAEYLALPIIEDYFKTDAERSAWREKLEHATPAAFAVYENNKLRMNKISSALQGLENILPAIEWTKLAGYGDLPAAHTEGLRETVKLWKRQQPPETLVKLDFVRIQLVPLLQHAFDSVVSGRASPEAEK
jgi:hypothetical protein